MRNLFILLILLAWALLGFKMCTDWSTCCVGDSDKSAISSTSDIPPAINEGEKSINCPEVPICFLTGSCEPSTGRGYAALIDSLLKTLGQQQKLSITGLYNASEENASEFENLGLCRADAIRRSIGTRLGGDRIILGAQRIVGQSGAEAGYATNLIRFEAVGEEVAPLPSGTLIYFPFGSSQQIRDAAVEKYLNEVAVRMKDGTQRIRLIGHTDNVGGVEDNLLLGRQRAEVIRDYLMTRGVPASKIIIESKGESQPVASNGTDRGRAQNRRTELQIIQ